MKKIGIIHCAFLVIFNVSLMYSSTKNTLTIGFAGDVMLGRLVNDILRVKKNPTYVWGNVLPLLQQNDINIINLENAITLSDTPVAKVFNFKTDPEHTQALVAGNITVVSLANNHILDYNYQGLFDTLQNLEKYGIGYVGAGVTIEQAQKPYIINKHGIKLGIIAFTDNEPGWLATANSPGINYIKVGDTQTLQKIIGQLKGNVDFIIATAHWGPNMREKPTQKFIDFAHAIIDLGVDIFHGHSAHIFQAVEIYRNKLIMYDTGDFVDDYAVDPLLRNNVSFLFQITVSKNKIENIQLIPVDINNMQVNVATGATATWAINRIQQLSKKFGTSITDEGSIIITNN